MESNVTDMVKEIQMMCQEVGVISQDFYKAILIAAIEKEGVPKSNLETDSFLARISYLHENAVEHNIKMLTACAETLVIKTAKEIAKKKEETAKKQSSTDEFFN